MPEIAVIIVEETTKGKVDISWAFSLPNAVKLMYLDNSYLGFVNGEDVYMYETALEPWYIIATVLASVAVSALCLLCGYIYFKKSDRH